MNKKKKKKLKKKKKRKRNTEFMIFDPMVVHSESFDRRKPLHKRSDLERAQSLGASTRQRLLRIIFPNTHLFTHVYVCLSRFYIFP